MKKLLLIAVMLLLSMHCIGYNPMVFRSPNSFNQTEINTTTGQELMDIKQALDTGAITQEEYDELRTKIMERYDAPVDSTDTN